MTASSVQFGKEIFSYAVAERIRIIVKISVLVHVVDVSPVTTLASSPIPRFIVIQTICSQGECRIAHNYPPPPVIETNSHIPIYTDGSRK